MLFETVWRCSDGTINAAGDEVTWNVDVSMTSFGAIPESTRGRNESLMFCTRGLRSEDEGGQAFLVSQAMTNVQDLVAHETTTTSIT